LKNLIPSIQHSKIHESEVLSVPIIAISQDASDKEVKSKLKSHEKRKLDACSMSPHELIEWEQQEASLPYQRTPPLKPRRKVTDTLAYTLPLVLKKKCRNKVNVTRKTRCLNNSKTMRLRKGCWKRVACGGHGQILGRLIGLNVHAVRY
ncbi:hypothetical protein Tco_1096206, partial [Tanacetum coccineum]